MLITYRLYLCTFILVLFNLSFAGEYQVDKSKSNQVKFISDAPIEDFEGITDKIDGYLYYEDEDLTKNSEVYFEVDLNTLDTGIGLRNRHMRENYLHTDKYPKTHYTGKIVKSIKKSDTEFEVETEGKIFIHGVTKPLNVKAIILKIDEKTYQIKTQFIVALSDFNIEVPSIMFYKIDEKMDLKLDFYLKKSQSE